MATDSLGVKRTALFVVSLGSFLSPFASASTNIALPSVGREFAVDAVLLGWVTTSYFLTAAALLLPFGRMADIYGRERFFKYGILVYTISSLFSAFSTSVVLLILFNILLGVGSAMIFCTGTAILTSVFPPGEQGTALGVNSATVYLGLSLGPFLGGVLTQRFGWRSIFLSMALIGLITAAIIFWRLKEEPGRPEREFNSPSALIYSLTVAVTIYGFSLLPTMPGLLLILAGALGVIAFVRREVNMENPMLDVRLFRDNTAFAFSNLAALLYFSSTFTIGFLLSLYLQYVQGISPQDTGLVIAAQSVIQTVFSPFAGRLSDRIEPRIVASTGIGLTVLGLALLTFLDKGTGLGFVVADLVLIGLGYAFFTSPNILAVMSSVGEETYGVASATRHTTRSIGQTLSIGIVMIVFATQMGRTQITPESYAFFLGAMKSALTILTILCVGSILPSLVRGKTR